MPDDERSELGISIRVIRRRAVERLKSSA